MAFNLGIWRMILGTMAHRDSRYSIFPPRTFLKGFVITPRCLNAKLNPVVLVVLVLVIVVGVDIVVDAAAAPIQVEFLRFS